MGCWELLHISTTDTAVIYKRKQNQLSILIFHILTCVGSYMSSNTVCMYENRVNQK